MSALDLAPAPADLTALTVGDEIHGQFGPITRTQLVRYAGAGGDFNPIHHDEEFAKSAGMPGVFSMGLFHGGVAGGWLAAWLGLEHVTALKLRFTGQVWPGDVLSLHARVDDIEEHADGRLVVCSLLVERQNGDVALKGEVRAR
jgi:acyl dehydratase